MSDVQSEVEKVKQRYKELAERTGTCNAFRVFVLGSHGTCYIGCGLPDKHWSSIDGEPGVTYPRHQAVQTDADGGRVIFEWPVT